MATYGRGQMLGSGINPESFKLDYSGMANAAATQAQGVANLGASIGGAISEVGDYFKKQAEDEKKVQKSLSVAKAIGDLIPGLKPTIQGSLNILNDKELPLSQRTAEADAIADILNLGINEVRNREDIGLKERELGIREAQFKAENVPSQRSVNLQQGEITETINGKQYKVPITFNPATGETRRLDGSVVGGGSMTSAAIDTGLNLPMPTAEGTAMPGDGTFPDYGGISDAMVLSPRVDPAAIAAAAELTGGQNDVSNVSPMLLGTPTTTQVPVVDGIPTGQAGGGTIPPGATLVQEKPEETYEQNVEAGGLVGQRNTKTGEFKAYPGQTGGRITRFNPDTGQFEIIEGSQAGAKAEKQERAAKFQETRQTNFIIDKANEAEEIIDNSISTYGGGTLIDMAKSAIPGTQEYKLKNQILPALKDSIALDSMKQLKAASPTGSTGLGALTEKEGKRLENMYGVLDVGGDKATLKNDIKRLKQTAFDYIHGSKDERGKALAEGNITKDQNDQVEQMYREQILGVLTPKLEQPLIGLSPEAEEARKIIRGQ